jgi:hypothetical protein
MRTVTHYEYEKTKNKALFDLICDKDNWKNPITCLVPARYFDEFNEACIFFTGGNLLTSENVKEGDPGRRVQCYSDGYYVNIGA